MNVSFLAVGERRQSKPLKTHPMQDDGRSCLSLLSSFCCSSAIARVSMAPRQGSKKTPHSFHSRSDSRLNENIQGTLILVLESGEFASDCNPKDIVRSNSAVFGDADAKQGTEEGKFVKSVTDKIRNLRLLKAEDPAEYW